MNYFWKSNTQMDEKEPSKPLKFEEFDFDQLLSKYGPEGLYELGDLFQAFALKDIEFANQMSEDEEDACYS